MKTHYTWLLAWTALLFASFPLHASQQFLVSLSGRCKSTNDTSKMVMKAFNNATILKECAQKQEPVEDARKLALVYDVDRDTFLVVTTADGRPLCELFGLSGGASFTFRDGTVRERQAFLFAEGETEARGSVVGTERSTRNGEGTMIRFQFVGRFQFTSLGSGTNSPAIYTGTFVTTRRFVPKNGDPGCTTGCPIPLKP